MSASNVRRTYHAISSEITLTTMHGVLTLEAIFDNIRHFQEHYCTTHWIIDLSDCSMEKIHQAELEEIGHFAREFDKECVESRIQAGGRAAYIAPGDLNYGILRIWEVVVEIVDYDIKICVCREKDEALDFINEGTCKYDFAAPESGQHGKPEPIPSPDEDEPTSTINTSHKQYDGTDFRGEN